MDIPVGAVLWLKKTHPCGSKLWRVLRVGADFHLRCEGCGKELWRTRGEVKKAIVGLEKGEKASTALPF